MEKQDIMERWDPTMTTPSSTPLTTPMHVETYSLHTDDFDNGMHEDDGRDIEPCSSYSSCEGCFSHAMCEEVRVSMYIEKMADCEFGLPTVDLTTAKKRAAAAAAAPAPAAAPGDAAPDAARDRDAWGWDIEFE